MSAAEEARKVLYQTQVRNRIAHIKRAELNLAGSEAKYAELKSEWAPMLDFLRDTGRGSGNEEERKLLR